MAILWRANFESSGLGAFQKVERVAADRIQVVPDPAGTERPVCRFTVLQGDDPINSSGDRAELVRSSAALNEKEGDTRVYRWRSFFAPDFPAPNTWQLVLQWHHSGTDWSPPLALTVTNNELRLKAHRWGTHDWERVLWRAPLVRGKWLDFILRVKWSADPKVGLVELYLDGVKVLAPTNEATLYAGQHCYLKVGLYRNESIAQPGVVYLDGLVMGTTLADVQPGPAPVPVPEPPPAPAPAASLEDLATATQAAVQLLTSSLSAAGVPRPVCDVRASGLTWYSPGGEGEADTVSVCARDAEGNWVWRQV